MAATSLFAWEGFSFRHPDDWAPVTLSGRRKEGYVRLQGSGRIGCQVRWKARKSGDGLERILEGYFRALRRDAKRERRDLTVRTEVDSQQRLTYRWHDSTQGRGALFHLAGRIFFVEVNGGKRDSLLPLAGEIVQSFSSRPEEGLERWAKARIEAERIGVVESVQGISWTEYTVTGVSNHAGTTPMRLRRDAGYLAASANLFARKLAWEMGGHQVARDALRSADALVRKKIRKNMQDAERSFSLSH